MNFIVTDIFIPGSECFGFSVLSLQTYSENPRSWLQWIKQLIGHWAKIRCIENGPEILEKSYFIQFCIKLILFPPSIEWCKFGFTIHNSCYPIWSNLQKECNVWALNPQPKHPNLPLNVQLLLWHFQQLWLTIMSSPRDFFPVSVRCIKILIQVGEWLCLLTVRGRICLLGLFAGLGYTEKDFKIHSKK